MPLEIIRNDITKMRVDAIVNAANNKLKMGGGVCGAIFAAAGPENLQAECDQIGGCPVGEAVITKGYKLFAKYVIHAVGPIWQGGNNGEAHNLRNAYLNSLHLALEHKCKSIAFPLISSGIYGYPKEQALQIAVATISEFLLQHEIKVYLVVYDKKAFMLSEKLFNSIEKYIDDNYVDDRRIMSSQRNIEDYEFQKLSEVREVSYSPSPDIKGKKKRSLKDIIGQLDETFSQMLLRLIDEKGITDVETYKRANVDRRLFSKIRSKEDYNPSKTTALAFAIALELNLDETRDLLNKAGYSLSNSHKFDLIIAYFIENNNYNIHEINEALFVYDQVLLGA
ncbi:MAG: macro domain-containing protein [Eubacteriales bacterium]|nr:macro domain-containing protein [Eubacteriales bacterium]